MPAPRPRLLHVAHLALTWQPTDAHGTRLSGRWLVRARVSWGILAGLMLALYVALLPDYWAQLRTVCVAAPCAVVQPTPASAHTLHQLGLTVAAYASWTFAITIASSAICLVVGGLIVWRRSDDWMALLVALTEVAMATLYAASVLVQGGHTAWRLPATALNATGSTILFLLFALFPSGRFAPRWLRWGVVAWGVCGAALIIWHDAPAAFTLYSLVWLMLATAEGIGQVYRYRSVSTPGERQQTRWVVLGSFTAGGIAVALILPAILVPDFHEPGSFYQLASGPGYLLAIVALSVAVGMAVLRSHLFDIDVIIRRTLIYGTVTATLAGVYFAVVLGTQAVAQQLTGEAGQRPMVTVASTLLIVVLFTPLRRRVQAGIDQAFYRSKYDAGLTLADLGAKLRTETDLGELRECVLDVVHETMRPAHLSLWLRAPNRHGAEPPPDADAR